MFFLIFTLLGSFAATAFFLQSTMGDLGLIGNVISNNPVIFLAVYTVLMTHITITCMSLSFHRFHTHKGVILNKYMDTFMQLWLWLVTTMSKVDWVSVHIYHHAHSDTEKDPHSPVTKGLMHVLFLGVFDYTKAKSSPDVERIKKTIKTNKLEKFIYDNPFVGPAIMTVFLMIVFGPWWGAALSAINFMISPVFAVGGVNALAHWFGYKNHDYDDNSRNLGFIVPLNFLVCGEMDHNNHHAHQRSCSFRHRWYEFDIGYAYLVVMKKLKLAELKVVYNSKTLRQDISAKVSALIDADQRFRRRCEEMAKEMNLNYQDLKLRMEEYMKGEKVKLEKSARQFLAEVERTLIANQRLKLSYN